MESFLAYRYLADFYVDNKKSYKKDTVKTKSSTHKTHRPYLFHLVIAILSFAGVAIGAFAVVQSVIMLSNQLDIPEFFISFFVLGIGTSIPELAVDLIAVRKRQYELAIGDIIGNCIVDSTVSIAAGQLFFPAAVFVEPSGRSFLLGLYAILSSRKRVDKKAGLLFVVLYLGSYSLLYAI